MTSSRSWSTLSMLDLVAGLDITYRESLYIARVSAKDPSNTYR
jgi:hypothetical protein